VFVWFALDGQMLSKKVAMCKASAQNFGGIEACSKRVPTISLRVQSERSALPF
jgi:hypothetical protein